MIFAGCDIGSLTAKVVILKDDAVIASNVIKRKTSPDQSAKVVMDIALSEVKLSLNDIDYCVATGYGKEHVVFAQSSESEISCHGKGAIWHDPDVKMIIDIGGQDAKAIKIDDLGNVTRYVYNDKCASGTGRFLEIIAKALDLELENLGEYSQQSKNDLSLSSQCVVFAETEIISMVSDGKEIPDIIKALHRAVANRVASLAKSIEVEGKVIMAGGVAKNKGMFEALNMALGGSLISMDDPQKNGALGAALIAAEKFKMQ
jgi:predicted CoA-substrate-specific enzyme activase